MAYNSVYLISLKKKFSKKLMKLFPTLPTGMCKVNKLLTFQPAQSHKYPQIVQCFYVFVVQIFYGFSLFLYNREKTERAGQVMRHRPMNARQTAAFWIEHVLQFGGKHLQPPSIGLTWWQFYCLDTLAVIAIILVLILWVIFVLFKLIMKAILKIALTKQHVKKE